MEQRTLRLGDVVDDYCPRERRLTNHVIAVMTGTEVHTTRCTTCDSDHPYKHGKTPARKPKLTAGGELVSAVLALAPGAAVPPASAPAPAVSSAPPVTAPIVAPIEGVLETTVISVPAAAPVAVAASSLPAAQPEVAAAPEAGWTHRPLIRASLPRIEGQVPAARPLPEFTMRQNSGGGRGGNDFRTSGSRRGQGGGNGQGNGQSNGRNRSSRWR